jgi:uncharacterized membrane protein YuzA (DUF378 family)
MLYAMIGLGALIILLSILFRVAAVFRLAIPLLYALIAPTLFFNWFHANQPLAEGIGYALVGLTVLSWIFSFIRKIRQWRDNCREDKIAEEIMLARIRDAKAEGRNTVSTEGLFRD